MSIMVSVMEFDANRELCDRGPRFDAITIGDIIQPPTAPTVVAAVADDDDDNSHGAVPATTSPTTTPDECVDGKASLRLELAAGRLEKGSLDDACEDGEKSGLKSPKTPISNSSKTGTKPATNATAASNTAAATSVIGLQKEIIEDRKALRDALYQGIFHRHRRTIFAMGSFIRMLKSRNSQYNTIRSASDGEEEPR